MKVLCGSQTELNTDHATVSASRYQSHGPIDALMSDVSSYDGKNCQLALSSGTETGGVLPSAAATLLDAIDTAFIVSCLCPALPSPKLGVCSKIQFLSSRRLQRGLALFVLDDAKRPTGLVLSSKVTSGS